MACLLVFSFFLVNINLFTNTIEIAILIITRLAKQTLILIIGITRKTTTGDSILPTHHTLAILEEMTLVTRRTNWIF